MVHNPLGAAVTGLGLGRLGLSVKKEREVMDPRLKPEIDRAVPPVMSRSDQSMTDQSTTGRDRSEHIRAYQIKLSYHIISDQITECHIKAHQIRSYQAISDQSISDHAAGHMICDDEL